MSGSFVILSWLTTAALAIVVFRMVVRPDYARRGQLSVAATALEIVVFALHANLAYTFLPVGWPGFPDLPQGVFQRWVGMVLFGAGLGLTLWAMAGLGIRKAMGRRQTAGLCRSGFYRYSRNPQIVAYGAAVVGVVVWWPSLMGVAWLLFYAGLAHLMVLTEEEHLRRVFGAEYESYCRTVPRYVPGVWPRP